MRLLITAAALAAVSTSANAAVCSWPADAPAKRTYQDIEGHVISVSSRVEYDKILGQGRRFTYQVKFVPGIKDYKSWTFMPKDASPTSIRVGDSFVWLYSDKLSKNYGKPHYWPVLVRRLSNGTCDLMRGDFSRPASAIPI